MCLPDVLVNVFYRAIDYVFVKFMYCVVHLFVG